MGGGGMKTSINLMTDEARRQQLLREAKRLWSAVLGVTFVVLCVVGSVHWWRGQATSQRLRTLEDRYAPVQALKKESIRLRTEINVMRDAQQLTLRLVDTRPTVTLIGAVSEAAASTSGKVYVEELEMDRGPLAGDERKAVLRGIGQDNAAIAQFTNALRLSKLFADVTLSSSDSSPLANQETRFFRIECSF
jgi:Tfp pilus assembly protein PilN